MRDVIPGVVGGPVSILYPMGSGQFSPSEGQDEDRGPKEKKKGPVKILV